MRHGFFLALLALWANADAATIPIGVWHGQIGKSAITACFNPAFEGRAATGHYYYRRYRIPIGLMQASPPDAEPLQYRERQGLWRLREIAPGRMRGVWQGPGRGRELTIDLRPLPPEAVSPSSAEEASEAVAPCASDAFNLPLEQNKEFQRSEVKQLGPLRYRELRFALEDEVASNDYFTLVGVELLGDTPALSSIRNQLAVPEPSELFECRRDAMSGAGQGEVNRYVRLAALQRWLLTVASGGHAWCVNAWGVHENVQVFDIESGAEVELLDWFSAAAEQEDARSSSRSDLPPPLADLLAQQLKQSEQLGHFDRAGIEECYGDFAGAGWRLMPGDQGIDFVLPITRNGSCGERIALPAPALWPLLNATGRRGFAELGWAPPAAGE